MSVIQTRGHQLFPVLDASQIDVAKRFANGPARDFAPGEIVYDVAERYAPVWLVLKGSIDVVRRDGLDHEAAITSLGAGQFSGEVSQLSGAATLASARAGPDGCTALPFDAAHVRALMIGSAEVGEIMMRAFILRRVGLIEEGGVGSVLVGKPGTPDLVRLQGFLGRNGYPYTVLDASSDAEGRAVVERSGVPLQELPLMVTPNGTILKRPTDAEAGAFLGITPELDPKTVYDLAVVGAGPAGLAADLEGRRRRRPPVPGRAARPVRRGPCQVRSRGLAAQRGRAAAAPADDPPGGQGPPRASPAPALPGHRRAGRQLINES